MPRKTLITHVLQRYWRLTRSLTMGTQGVIIDDKDRVLLVRHTYRPGWHFPGGGVEANETVIEALSRELQEEAGIVIDGEPELFGIYGNFTYFPSDHVALFVIRNWRQTVAPKPNREIAEHRFYAQDNLPSDLQPASERRLGEIFKGHRQDALW